MSFDNLFSSDEDDSDDPLFGLSGASATHVGVGSVTGTFVRVWVCEYVCRVGVIHEHQSIVFSFTGRFAR